jgi:plasmid stabilization system protein ParE
VSKYQLDYLPKAELEILEAENDLYAYSPAAADKFEAAIARQEALLADNPLMYQVYDDRPYFRCMNLPYKYLCFYHVDEDAGLITVHRLLHGMRDIASIL